MNIERTKIAMMNSKQTTSAESNVDSSCAHPATSRKSKKAYETPELIFYGDVRDVTLGPTVGSGESGCESFLERGPATLPCPFP